MAISLQNHENRIVKLENNAASGKGLGYGQQWYDVTAKRSTNVKYTNNTGQPICVNMYDTSSIGAKIFLHVDGVAVTHYVDPTDGADTTTTTIIPPGSQYWVSYKDADIKWFELRSDNK